MENQRANDIAEQELKKLEFRVNELIQTCERLKAENRSLRERHHALAGERDALLEKNELARSQVEAMLTRLRSIESLA